MMGSTGPKVFRASRPFQWLTLTRTVGGKERGSGIGQALATCQRKSRLVQSLRHVSLKP